MQQAIFEQAQPTFKRTYTMMSTRQRGAWARRVDDVCSVLCVLPFVVLVPLIILVRAG